jgi:hypothetical protein
LSSVYDELREDIPVLDVLLEIGARTIGWSRGGGWSGWKEIVCPFCSDTNGSGSYNSIAGRYLCHQCGAPRDGRSGDVVDIAKLYLGTNEDREAIEWLRRTFRT